MSIKILEKLEKEQDFQTTKISFSPEYCLKITSPHLFSASTLAKLLYFLHNKLNYLFYYLDYQINVEKNNFEVSKKTIQEYFSLICSTPFLWKNKEDLSFFCQQKELLEEFEWKNNIVYLYFSNQKISTNWKPKLIFFKEILTKLGLPNIRFSLKKKSKEETNNNGLNNNKNGKNNNIFNNFSANNNAKKLNKLVLFTEWRKRKIFELGVHTKFSTLDGISSPSDYVKNAQQKNYGALAVTDNYNVQSFPEFSKWQNKDLKIIYGCEMEMLEDNLPSYIFNNPKKVLDKEIDDLTYCVFDLETTGFFSEYNEIIEIGYVVYHHGKIIREGEYLICPEKEIAPEILATWYTNIDPEELKKSPKISEILPLLEKDWENCILVAHNAKNFDYGFLNKVWKNHFDKELPYSIIDTLPLSWILLPERKSYSLERLSQVAGRTKISQTHRALDDCKLLGELLGKLLKILKEKNINYWIKVKELINIEHFPNRGQKIKVLATNQEGLHNLYNLITISHTKSLFRKPSIFRSDLVKYRSGILIGAAGGREGEIFSLFSSFNSEEKRQTKMKFYDYIEINSPKSFCYLWLNGKIRETELKEMLEKIIINSNKLNIPSIANHNVYYCDDKEKILKEIVIANEGMNGIRHYLYNEATLESKEDRFSYLPPQHLPNLEEIIDNWLFLNNKNLLEKVIFNNPQQLVKKIGEVNIQQPPLNYSSTENVKGEENDLVLSYTNKTNELFGNNWPEFVKERIEKEWKIIKGRYVFIYWLAHEVVKKTNEKGQLVGSRGSIGSSFVAYLCGITDLNPLPFYKFCKNCRYSELYHTNDKTYSCYDYTEKEKCPNCSFLLTMEGHNLPLETFFGWKGEKIPDIDLNFSGEYQRTAHNYVRQLLGEKSVYRIGTINTLSEQTAEIFYKQHLKLRKELNSPEHFEKMTNSELMAPWQKKHWEELSNNRKDFKEEEWYKGWIDKEKLKELQRKYFQLRREKAQLEELRKLEE